MKTRTVITLALTLLFAVGLVAEPQKNTRTIVIKDGKVVSGGDDFPDLAGELLGGKRAHLGVSLVDLTTELREHYGAEKSAGVLVGAVEKDSPAEKAGLRVGDIVLAVDGKDVDSSSDVRAALRDKKEGDSVRVEALRGRTRQTFVASVVEREGLRILTPRALDRLPQIIEGGEWNARLDRLMPNCGDLQGRIKELETRLKDLEKKLQK
jgi:membrane-associated protease RseP (regulator of RpoE activity)